MMRFLLGAVFLAVTAIPDTTAASASGSPPAPVVPVAAPVASTPAAVKPASAAPTGTSAAASGLDSLRVDSILASVNGVPVSLLDVLDESNQEEARLSMMYGGEELRGHIRQLRRKILDDIIDRKLIVEDYRRDPFDIPRQSIENMIDELSISISGGTRQELKKKIAYSGITLDDLEEKARDRIIVDFMIGNLFFKNVAVTPREVYEYFKQHAGEFSVPARIRLEVLYLPQDRANLQTQAGEIANDLKSQNAKIFNSLVMLHSAAPNAKNGGDLGWIETGKLRPEFARAVENQAVGYISGSVQTPEGIYFLRIAELDKGGAKPFESACRQITDQLRRDQRRQAYKEYLARLRKDALIRYYIN